MFVNINTKELILTNQDKLELFNLQKEYARLWHSGGLCAVNDDSIHLEEGCFRANFKEYAVIKRNDTTYPYKLVAKIVVDGVATPVFCICKEVWK